MDRSASYMARYVAKNIVASGIAKKCEVQVAYAIGVAEPVSVMVDTMGTGLIPKERVREIVREVFDLSPAAIIEIPGSFAAHLQENHVRLWPFRQQQSRNLHGKTPTWPAPFGKKPEFNIP